MIRQTKIIAGFPGVGKSFFRSAMGADKSIRISDSDSSQFHWIVENGEKKENPHFIEDYLHHIKSLLMKVDIVFVSTHEEILLALREEGIDFTIVYPDHSLKEEFIRRYRRRKSPESFIALLDNKFDEWVDGIEEKYLDVPKIKLMRTDEYLEKEMLMNCESVDLSKVKKYVRHHLYGKASYQKTESAEENEKHTFCASLHETATLKFRIANPDKTYVKWLATIQRASNVSTSEFRIPEKGYDRIRMSLDKTIDRGPGLGTGFSKRWATERLVEIEIEKPTHDKVSEEWTHFLDRCISSLYEEVDNVESDNNHFVINEFDLAFQNFSNYGNRVINTL